MLKAKIQTQQEQYETLLNMSQNKNAVEELLKLKDQVVQLKRENDKLKMYVDH
jgi:hypothetical protein